MASVSFVKTWTCMLIFYYIINIFSFVILWRVKMLLKLSRQVASMIKMHKLLQVKFNKKIILKLQNLWSKKLAWNVKYSKQNYLCFDIFTFFFNLTFPSVQLFAKQLEAFLSLHHIYLTSSKFAMPWMIFKCMNV